MFRVRQQMHFRDSWHILLLDGFESAGSKCGKIIIPNEEILMTKQHFEDNVDHKSTMQQDFPLSPSYLLVTFIRRFSSISQAHGIPQDTHVRQAQLLHFKGIQEQKLIIRIIV